jgi:beta-glucosidase
MRISIAGRRTVAATILMVFTASGASFENGPAPQPQAKAQWPWLDPSLSPDARAELVLDAMALDEKIGLVHGRFAIPFNGRPKPDGAIGSAGYVAGIPRLGIPALQESDAGLGVANPVNVRPGDEATALPSGLAMAATFDPALAERGGAMIGAEARAKGFNVLLAGGANLVRDPRNGRNFEYAAEDPLLTGMVVGAAIRGVQSNRIISTIKHYVLNAQETGRTVLSANIDEAAAREADLLAFQIAIEQGQPHAVMCGYNRVNGIYNCENQFLLGRVLKGDWGYPGFVMSDWGALHSTEAAALAGLDQESGEELDAQVFFGAPLRQAVEAGRVPRSRLDDMVRRILRAMFASSIIDQPAAPGGVIDYGAHALVAQAIAEQGLVLLRNENGLLPLPQGLRRILVIGSHADRGVLSGGGSSQVIPVGGNAVPGLGPKKFPGPTVYVPSSPLASIVAEAGGAQVDYFDGSDIAAAQRGARDADAVIIFAHQWTAEMVDRPDLSLPDDQDRLIGAVARVNPHTIVVLETGGPVTMPWLADTPAVIAAWYPGARGGEAIARALFGRVNPSGRLPITFPRKEEQLPRPKIPGGDQAAIGDADPYRSFAPFDVNYIEGADVGYKWFEKRGERPLYPFGYGLSYTTFALSRLTAAVVGSIVTVQLDVTNTGERAGIDTPQIYLRRGDDASFPIRLAAFTRVPLAPGETRQVTLAVDPRLLARFDASASAWHIAPGRFTLHAGTNARDLLLSTEVTLAEARLKP